MRNPIVAAPLVGLLVAGALAGCDRPRGVVERDTTTVVHDRPVIIHEDQDRHPGDRGPPPPRDRHDDRR